jgi:pSer/pThr/pTyr-binding forkhead associated (FHA) protein
VTGTTGDADRPSEGLAAHKRLIRQLLLRADLPYAHSLERGQAPQPVRWMSTNDDDHDPHTLSGARVENWSESLTTEASIELLMPDRARRPPMLRQITGPGAPRDLSFTQAETIIGRSKAADFSIDSPELSRQHVVAQLEGQEVEVRDLDSRNGLYLNGIRVYVAVLRSGDHLQVGNVTFVFAEGG